MSSGSAQDDEALHDIGFSEALTLLSKAERQKTMVLEEARAEADSIAQRAHTQAMAIEASAADGATAEQDRVLALANREIEKEEAQIAENAEAEVAGLSKRSVSDAQLKTIVRELTG